MLCLGVFLKLDISCIDLTGLIVFPCCSDGGFFNAVMKFPSNYPNSPPTVKFTSEIWHPNGEHLSSVFEFLDTVLFLFFRVGLMSWICLNCSLPRWKGLHFNSSSPWCWSNWLWASKRALESSPYSMYWFVKMLLFLFHHIYV